MSERPGFWKRMAGAFKGGVTGAAGPPDAGPSDYGAAYTAGMQAFRERRFEDAVRAFSAAIRYRPEDTCSWEMFGSSLGNLGRYEESLQAFARVLELGHECESCWYNRSIANWALGRRDATLRALESVVRINPDHVRAWCDRGLILGGLSVPGEAAGGLVGEPFDGRHEQAVTCFDRALAIDPENADVWHWRGLVLGKLCHRAQVRNRTIDLTGGPALPFEELVRLAAESFDRAAALRPQDTAAREARENLLSDLFGDGRDAGGVEGA